MKPREALDAMTDLVLAHKPKPKSAPAKARKRKAQGEKPCGGVMYIIPKQ
jgi:hypothetical protein